MFNVEVCSCVIKGKGTVVMGFSEVVGWILCFEMVKWYVHFVPFRNKRLSVL